jgi:uncharacterized membrane protein
MIRIPIYSIAWRAVVVLLTLDIAMDSALRYFTGTEPPPPPILANGFANPFLVVHVAAGVTALLVGPLQFVSLIRARWPAFHRATGRVYIAGCAIGVPTGLMLALGTTAGPVAGLGFAVQSLLWALFTWLACRAILERRFDDHREWMLRSYAITSSAITLRLMLPASTFLGFEFVEAYRVIAWLTWTTNLALFEYWIRRSRASTASYVRLASA